MEWMRDWVPLLDGIHCMELDWRDFAPHVDSTGGFGPTTTPASGCGVAECRGAQGFKRRPVESAEGHPLATANKLHCLWARV